MKPYLIGMLILAGLAGCQHQLGSSASPSSALPQDPPNEWLCTETVAYSENHDPSMIWLEDGRQLQVFFGKITWKEVEKWETGRKLILAYSEQRGCVLIDWSTRKQLPVIGGWGNQHPLDVLLKHNLELTVSTMDIIEAYDSNIGHWTAEVARLYRLYLESSQVPESAKAALRSEQDLWAKFCEGHRRAMCEFYSIPSGTMWSIKGSEYYHAFIREQAARLQALSEALVYSSNQSEKP